MLRAQFTHHGLPTKNISSPRPRLASSFSQYPSIGFSAKTRSKSTIVRYSGRSTSIRAVATEKHFVASTEKDVEVCTGVLTVKPSYFIKSDQRPTFGGLWRSKGIDKELDHINDLLGHTISLELVSANLDSDGNEKERIKVIALRDSAGLENDDVKYEALFSVPADFGLFGAIIVENGHEKEMYLHDITILAYGSTHHFPCAGWVASKLHSPNNKRVFFTNQDYLPSQTPNGLKTLREEELVTLRGNGEGERQPHERIYDYDIYNDLGDPDRDPELKRPPLGGSKLYPYPRRCRTGRPPCETDPRSESRIAPSTSPLKGSYFYVPSDERFAEVKELSFFFKSLLSYFQVLLPSFEDVKDSRYIADPSIHEIGGPWQTLVPHLFHGDLATSTDALSPATIPRDWSSGFSDEEFGRQILAGINPYTIELVTEWPLMSKLDPNIYGNPESAITADLIEREIEGITVQKATEEKKLFMLDFHDLLLPYVSKVRQLPGTTLYGSRAIFFKTSEGAMKPIAIELVRPPMDGKPQWKGVYSPGGSPEYSDDTNAWLWKFAKVHVLAHDIGFHQLSSHWLRTHAAFEPYIIATNRQLSAMHPIYKLLHPHLRYTLDLNTIGRESLFSAGGTLESFFTPQKHSVELSSAIYDKLWRFDQEALPADLIKRGMAVEDSSEPHGVKLVVEDYPFAKDGLDLYGILKEWVKDYVDYYYYEKTMVQLDSELQAWWTEIRTVGHADKKDEPWWPSLNTREDLIGIITTIIWVASGHHAAVNFGQYPTYAGKIPPTIARTKMPTEDPTEEEWNRFLNEPKEVLFECLPDSTQVGRVMLVLNLLSCHSPDEEYLGEFIKPTWEQNVVIKEAFDRFNGRLRELERIIDERNANSELINRKVPYTLLKPFSDPGITKKGVPYSISI